MLGLLYYPVILRKKTRKAKKNTSDYLYYIALLASTQCAKGTSLKICIMSEGSHFVRSFVLTTVALCLSFCVVVCLFKRSISALKKHTVPKSTPQKSHFSLFFVPILTVFKPSAMCIYLVFLDHFSCFAFVYLVS